MTLPSLSRLTPKPNVHARRFDDEVVILDLEAGSYFGLDEVGADMWERFATGKNVSEVVQHLVAKYQVPVEQATRDVIELMLQLSEAGLAVISTPEAI